MCQSRRCTGILQCVALVADIAHSKPPAGTAPPWLSCAVALVRPRHHVRFDASFTQSFRVSSGTMLLDVHGLSVATTRIPDVVTTVPSNLLDDASYT